MNEVVVYSLGSVILVSLISFIGIFTLSIKVQNLKKILTYMISFAAGGLLGDAFIHLLPEAIHLYHACECEYTMPLLILAGIAVAFILEKVIRWRHCHHPTTDEHPHPVAIMNLFGDGVHNFIDGMIIGAAYIISIPAGIATTIAVVLHEIPQEIGDFGILLHGGYSKGKALILNFVIGLTAVLGVVLTLILSSYGETLIHFLIPFTIGSFIYIAVADLIPEMHKEVAVWKSLLQFFFFIIGIALMFLILFVPGHIH
jgi:zinc and cadmium transporter